MAFADMIFELVGDIPGLPAPKAQTLINEGLVSIYDSHIWSWQFREGAWFTPGLLFAASSGTQSVGTIKATLNNNQVIGDSVASAAWSAYNIAGTQPILSQLQIRTAPYSLYNIIQYDTTSNPPFGTLTLDRNWIDPAGTGLAYMVYQAYFVVPDTVVAGAHTPNFRRFLEIRDTTNAAPMDYWTYSRQDLAVIDPQRLIYNLPAYVVAYETDQRVTTPANPTIGSLMIELWPHPLTALPYTFSFLKRGTFLVNPSDTVPYPLTDDSVKWKAREFACTWKEMQKGDGIKRGDGADWTMLATAASAEYEKRIKLIKEFDRDLMPSKYFTRFVRGGSRWDSMEPFASIGGLLNVGRF